jgi:hypothetical protein
VKPVTFLLFSLLAVGDTPNRSTIRVCDVLSNLKKYENLEISVRGEWVHTEHGMYLRQSCGTKLITKAHVWPNSIWIQLPWLEREDPVNYVIDKRKLSAARERADGILSRARPGAVVYATFTGKLQARESLTAIPRTNGGTMGNGFGHLNAFPAQIVIRSVENISISP